MKVETAKPIIDELSKEAMEFVKNNCMTWCNFEGCSTRECEKKVEERKKIKNKP